MFTGVHRDDRMIVFVIMRYKPRYIKMARALQKKNFKLVFIVEDNIFNKENRKEIPWNIRTRFFHTPEEALSICQEYKPLVFHIFVEKEYSVSYFLIQNKDKLGKIVYSEYDLFWGYYRNSLKKGAERAVKRERYCFEQADGICFRDWSGKFLEEKSDFDIKGKWVMLLDGCSNIRLKRQNRNKLHTELSICYAGEILSDKKFRKEEDKKLIRYAEKCEKEKAHLYVYPTIKDDYLFSEYIKMDRKMKYFHFYDPLPYSELIQRISQFDYGTGLSTPQQDYLDEINFRYACANKYFDYLDAEIPLIDYILERPCRMLEKMGACVRLDLLDADFDMLRARKFEYKKAAILAKSKLNIDHNIMKLVEFYENL